MEYRTCSDCGKSAYLPSPGDKANPAIRDKCIDCISTYQREHEKPDEPETGEWFT